MAWYKKILIAVLSIIVLIAILDLALNFWIERQLPVIINENNHSPYHITYKDLEISLLDRNLHATNIVAVPKISLNDPTQKAGYYAKVKSIDVNGFSILDILRTNRITARSLVINYPEATLFKDPDKIDTKKSSSVEYFNKIIYVSDIYLNHGNFGITDIKNDQRLLKLTNITFRMDGILVTDATLSNTIPFTYKDFLFKTDSLYYRKPFYHIYTGGISATDHEFKVESAKMIPVFGRKAFLKIIPAEKDLYTILTRSMSVHNIDWGFKNEKFYFHASKIDLNGAKADIYRGKMPPDDKTPKKLFSKMLREVKFDLRVDTLRVRNSNVVYEEEKSFENGPGKISFSRFNLYAVNIMSGFGRKKIPDVRIHTNCLFMSISPFKSDWSFNVLDRSDSFRIKGSILHFPAEKLAPFTKPYSNTIVKGDLDEIYFDFTGDSHRARGTFGINYDDLKVTVYKKKDRKKKNKLLSAIVNLFVKNDSKEKVKRTKVAVDRVAEKSFFNLLWIAVEDGLKKILL